MNYKGKEVKIIQEYKDFVLVEHKEGYRECINKHDLGLIKEVIPGDTNYAIKMPKI